MNNIAFTIYEIRDFKGFENLTDEQASRLSEFLAMYAIIVFNNRLNKIEDEKVGRWCFEEVW